jgi:hypothetical protein
MKAFILTIDRLVKENLELCGEGRKSCLLSICPGLWKSKVVSIDQQCSLALQHLSFRS